MLPWLISPIAFACLGMALPLEDNFELVNGDIVDDPAELPFFCRVKFRVRGDTQLCGATLISPDFLVTAKHCIEGFYDDDICTDYDDCYVACRDLNRAQHDVGEFRVSILDVFFKSGRSDLGLVKLKEKVHEHKDYDKGVPIVPVTLASVAPEPGDEVLTAGWGQTGFGEGFSDQLQKLTLRVTSVEELFVKTNVTNI